ncbi:hypothetical protein M2281_005080 [Mesorhizobium soli]|nr:hypothetical protein [Mesorhizobium soli]
MRMRISGPEKVAVIPPMFCGFENLYWWGATAVPHRPT